MVNAKNITNYENSIYLKNKNKHPLEWADQALVFLF